MRSVGRGAGRTVCGLGLVALWADPSCGLRMADTGGEAEGECEGERVLCFHEWCGIASPP